MGILSSFQEFYKWDVKNFWFNTWEGRPCTSSGYYSVGRGTGELAWRIWEILPCPSSTIQWHEREKDCPTHTPEAGGRRAGPKVIRGGELPLLLIRAGLAPHLGNTIEPTQVVAVCVNQSLSSWENCPHYLSLKQWHGQGRDGLPYPSPLATCDR